MRPQSSPKSLANLPSVPRAFELLHGGEGTEETGVDARRKRGVQRGEGTTGRRENLFEYLG